MSSIDLRSVGYKPTRDVLRYLQKQPGIEISISRHCHVKVKHQGQLVTVASGTSSSATGHWNFLATLRRTIPDVMKDYTR